MVILFRANPCAPCDTFERTALLFTPIVDDPYVFGTAHTLRNLADLPTVYAQIETTLRNQILAFARTDRGTHENEWRSMQVEVNGAQRVFAPEGYYASW